VTRPAVKPTTHCYAKGDAGGEGVFARRSGLSELEDSRSFFAKTWRLIEATAYYT